MKKIHISYGDQLYAGSLKLLEKSSIEKGKVDQFIPYTKKWLEQTNFYKKNKFILKQNRGSGYWIWKPYIILNTFKQIDDGDIVMYTDAGMEVIEDLSPLYNIAKNEGYLIFRIAGHHLNKTWTKRDTFVLMNLDKEYYWNAIQTTASYSLWVKNKENINFLKEYQRFLRDPRIVTDLPNVSGQPNFLEFRDHRHDQSVLSLMTLRNKMNRHRDPSQYGNNEVLEFSNSPYKQMFNHHRKKL